jgi:hypothetical protein
MKTLRIGLLIIVILSLTVVGYFGAAYLPFQRPPQHQGDTRISIPNAEELQTYFTVKTIVSTVNTGLVICLLTIYLGIYQKTRAEFALGLIIFTMTLLLYAVTSNPLLLVLLMFRPYALGLFTALPELFTTAAVTVLLYLSLK